MSASKVSSLLEYVSRETVRNYVFAGSRSSKSVGRSYLNSMVSKQIYKRPLREFAKVWEINFIPPQTRNVRTSGSFTGYMPIESRSASKVSSLLEYVSRETVRN
jgi:hypothetical protein